MVKKANAYHRTLAAAREASAIIRESTRNKNLLLNKAESKWLDQSEIYCLEKIGIKTSDSRSKTIDF